MGTLTRTTWTDDDGTGTSGTILNNAILQAIYDAIEAEVKSATYGAVTTKACIDSVVGGAAGKILTGAGLGSQPSWVQNNIFSVARTVMAGNATLVATSAPYQFFDPDAAREVTLPANATGLGFVIKNFDNGGFVLTVKDAAAATVTTVVNGQTVTVIYDGTAWQVIG